jgi:hypothetical protein
MSDEHTRSSADTGEASDPIRWIKDTYLMWLKGDLDPAHMRLGQHFFRAQPQAARELGSMSAQWAFDLESGSYYFAPLQASPPPYDTREVTAIIDIASDGTLAGVKLVQMRANMPLPAPPLSRPK